MYDRGPFWDWLCSYACRQKEALKNATEAFHEEKTAHIELYQKQQQVRTAQNITMKSQRNELPWFRKFGSHIRSSAKISSSYPMFSEALAGHCRYFLKLWWSCAIFSEDWVRYIRYLTNSPFCFAWIPFNIARSSENLATERCRLESHKCAFVKPGAG